MKNVLIISTSLRAHSNSEALAAAFEGGAQSAGHHVETVTLRGKNLRLAAFRGDRITVRGQLLSLELEEARA